MRWSENETCKFVKLYLSYPLLFNPEHSFYRLKNKRTKAYKEIITQFNDITGISLTETELKIKIKNLRSTYSQELSKIKTRSGPDWTYKPTIRWFVDWHKCFSHMKKNGETSFDDQQELPDNSCPPEWVTEDENNIHQMESDPFPAMDDEYKLLVLKDEPDTPMQEKRSLYKVKKKKMRHTNHSTDFNDKTFRHSVDSCSETNKEDEFDIYGKYIASQLRKMDLQKALRLQLQIQSLVNEARISDLVSE